MINNNYYVYFLKSLKDNNCYIGCTGKKPNDRLKEHNSGQVRSTKHRRPFILIHFESYHDKGEAFKREWHLKHSKGYHDKLDILSKIEW